MANRYSIDEPAEEGLQAGASIELKPTNPSNYDDDDKLLKVQYYQAQQDKKSCCYCMTAKWIAITVITVLSILVLFLLVWVISIHGRLAELEGAVPKSDSDEYRIPTSIPTTMIPTNPFPTRSPIISESSTHDPSKSPATSPTDMSSASPTVDIPTHHVGDYKMSILNQSHDNWLLCDGSFLDPKDYPELFSVVGFIFGSKTSTDEWVPDGQGSFTFKVRFGLPNAKDRVIGLSGDKYNTGETIGNHNISLNITHIPAHSHFMLYDDYMYSTAVHTATLRSQTAPYLPNSAQGYYPGGSQSNSYSYNMGHFGTNSTPNVSPTGDTGSGQSFEVYQPTLIIGNLFIYAGEM